MLGCPDSLDYHAALIKRMDRRRMISKKCPWLALIGVLVVGSSVKAATSEVVGVYPINLPAGNSAWVCGLVTTVEFQAAAATVTPDTDGQALVTFAEPGWTAGQFPLHYAEPLSGTSAGLAIDIISNTSNTLKLRTTPAAAGLVSGMVFVVRKHATLKGLIPDGGGLLPLNDSISLVGTNGLQKTYYYLNSGSRWIDGAAVNSNNVIIRPGQGFVLSVANPLTLTLGRGDVCHVKTTATKINAAAGIPNLVGPISPLGLNTTLGTLGITGSLQAFNDSLVVLAPGSLLQSGVYVRSGSSLINSGGQNSNSVLLPTGASVVVNVNSPKNLTFNPVTVSP